MISSMARNLRQHSVRSLSSLLLNQSNAMLEKSSGTMKLTHGISKLCFRIYEMPTAKTWNFLSGARGLSANSMRSKVEKRMQRESGKTLKEIRRARKLRKKLMTEEERFIYNLRRAKKKVAVLLQKLKKYELPELPQPRHDPELFTAEQLQAFRKIGFRNKNYVPVGVRGVFGGVVQNMHLHWKFHETVQVCCDNFPKEKIKEMATMLARLSGGIVVNIHNGKTIIMFRGRNYRQPKNLIPINTLTKRKALFKARYEQALESQKLNIKKIEQELRRKGVNPDDPIAMASIHRVASTFFNAIDKREGSPYVFREDNTKQLECETSLQQPQGDGDDSDQEELDRFIAEIEDAADKEWAAEEAAEKEELGHIRYWNREDFGGRLRKSAEMGSEDSDDGNRDRPRNRQPINRRKMDNHESEDEDGEWDSDSDDSEGTPRKFAAKKVERWQHPKTKIANAHKTQFERSRIEYKGRKNENNFSESSDVKGVDSGSEEEGRRNQIAFHSYKSSSDDEDCDQVQRHSGHSFLRDVSRGPKSVYDDNEFSEPEDAAWESDATSGDDRAK